MIRGRPPRGQGHVLPRLCPRGHARDGEHLGNGRRRCDNRRGGGGGGARVLDEDVVERLDEALRVRACVGRVCVGWRAS